MAHQFQPCHNCGVVNHSSFSRNQCSHCKSDFPWRFYNECLANEEVGRDKRSPYHRVSESTHELLSGRMEIAEWHERLRQSLFEMHLAEAAHAREQSLSAFVWKKLCSEIARMFSEFDELAEEFCQDPEKQRNLDRSQKQGHPFLNRVSKLVSGGRCTYENIRLWGAMEQGGRMAQRIMGAEACCRSCKREAARGWVPIADVLPIGHNEAGGECWCTIVTR